MKLTLASSAQAAAGSWNIASGLADVSSAEFEVFVGDISIASGLAIGSILADGDFAGWGFAVENSVLKFKQLA